MMTRIPYIYENDENVKNINTDGSEVKRQRSMVDVKIIFFFSLLYLLLLLLLLLFNINIKYYIMK